MIVFIPALLLAGVALFVRVVQYEPLYPDQEDIREPEVVTVPIFADDPIIGNKKAPITIVAFEDFGCPACQQQTAILDEIISQYPKRVKVIWKGLPVTQFPVSTELAQRYGYCAHRQGKFEPFKTFAFENIGNLTEQVLEEIIAQVGVKDGQFRDCLTSDSEAYIERTKQVAKFLNIQAVPTIFIDDKQVDPPLSIEGWEQYLQLNQPSAL